MNVNTQQIQYSPKYPNKKRMPNLINKKYLAAKFARNITLLPAAANLGIAMLEAHSHSALSMTFFAGFGFFFLKCTEASINKMLQYRDTYKVIQNRTLNIALIRLNRIITEIKNKRNLNKMT